MNQDLIAAFNDFVEKLKAEIISQVKADLASSFVPLSPNGDKKEPKPEPKPESKPEPAPVPVAEPVSEVVEPVSAEAEVVEPPKTVKIDKSLFPESLHPLLNLLASEDWPEAAPQFLICEDSQADKFERAEGILDYIGNNFSDKKVLDFGCGEGHVAVKAAETASLAVGYDIVNPSLAADKPNCILTTDFEKVKENGPYDLIILYDVLDHCEDPVAALEQVKSVSNPESVIFVRCHSWMSRHGAHLYKQLNKAWVHVFFTQEELEKMGVKFEFVRKYYTPIGEQNNWFEEAGLSIKSSDIIKTSVEPFFRRPEFVPRIPELFKGQLPEWQMSQVFNDYFLKS